MKDHLTHLTEELVRIQSTAKNPEGLDEILAFCLARLPGMTVEHFEKNGSKSVLIYAAEARPDVFKIILNSHLDTIPGKEEQLFPRIVENRLYGVGAMDMKASVACVLGVFQELAPSLHYPLGLQLVTDEQIGGFNGTKHQVEQGVKADFVIATEPTTHFGIVNQAKGIIQLTIKAVGKSAHGAYPWRGQNAIWMMHDLLSKLQTEFPNPTEEAWVTTLNVAKIETTNTAVNKIPDDCSILIDTRFVPAEAETILDRIIAQVPPNFTVSVESHDAALFVDPGNAYVTALQAATERVTGEPAVLYSAQGSSDARHFTKAGMQGVEFGPQGGNNGADDEWVDLESLVPYSQILRSFLLAQ